MFTPFERLIMSIRFASVLFALSSVMCSLTACGGGSTAQAEAQPAPPASISLSSYINTKEYSSFSNSFPVDQYGQRLRGDAQAFFKYADGTEGLFVSRLTYFTQSGPGAPSPAEFKFFKKVNGTWQETELSIDRRVPNCIHPRKAIVADYNLDGVADIVVACHGYDVAPFPGEHSVSIISNGSGYTQNRVTDVEEFYHGGSAHDFNGDGYPDIVLTLKNGTRTFLNNGSGQFTPSNEYSFSQFRRAFHVELIDVNNDGKFDIVGGSHEWEDPTRIVINPGNNKFGFLSTTITIPPVPGGGTIVDFVYVKSVNSLYVLRTGDGRNNGTVFYQGLWLQKFSLDTRVSTVLIADPNWIDPRYTSNQRWLRWIDEENGYIVSNWGEAIKVKVE